MARTKQRNGSRITARKSARKAPRKTMSGKGPILPMKRAYRRKPGTKALQEIRRYQKSTELLIPKAPFVRLVKEIMAEVGGHEMRIKATALEALQESAEALLIAEFELTLQAAIHAKRVTIQQKDMKLVQSMRLGMLGIRKVGERL